MIAGTVTGDREIVIQLEAPAADQSPVSIEAVVDTGFNGFLTLPIDAFTASMSRITTFVAGPLERQQSEKSVPT